MEDLNELYGRGSPAGSDTQYVVQSVAKEGAWHLSCFRVCNSEWYELILTHDDVIAHMRTLGVVGDSLAMYCARVRKAFLSDGLLVSEAKPDSSATLTVVTFLDGPAAATRQITHVYRLPRVEQAAAASDRLAQAVDALVALSVRLHVAEKALLRANTELASARDELAAKASSTSPAVVNRRRGRGSLASGSNKSPVAAAPVATLSKRTGWGLINPTAKRSKPTGAKIVAFEGDDS